MPKIRFTFSIGPSHFLEIAKFRAARHLWATIVEQYTKDINLQKQQYTEFPLFIIKRCMICIIICLEIQLRQCPIYRGADEITILPLLLLGNETEFGDRIARNTQLLLKEESHFGKVADPAAGSLHRNAYTKSSRFCMETLQTIEENGGFQSYGVRTD